MTGETSLPALLRTLSPRLQEGEYVFCCVPDRQMLGDAEVLGSFREHEGLTAILPRTEADRLQLPYDYVAAWLTLDVHSALAAVGLTAAVSGALAAADISCNVIAAYHHDHLFVAREDGEQALAVLQKLARNAV